MYNSKIMGDLFDKSKEDNHNITYQPSETDRSDDDDYKRDKEKLSDIIQNIWE